MSYQLTNEDKISIIDQHLRNLEFSKYNYQMTILEENAAAEPDQTAIDAVNEKIGQISAKIAALEAEKAPLLG